MIVGLQRHHYCVKLCIVTTSAAPVAVVTLSQSAVVVFSAKKGLAWNCHKAVLGWDCFCKAVDFERKL